jgi:hypothetical protein
VASSWEELLSQLEECADDYRHALETGAPFRAAPLLPASIGPLPPELAERARRVLAQIGELEALARSVRDGIGHFLALADLPPSPKVSAYFDSSA